MDKWIRLYPEPLSTFEFFKLSQDSLSRPDTLLEQNRPPSHAGRLEDVFIYHLPMLHMSARSPTLNQHKASLQG